MRFSDAQHVRWSSVNAASDASVLRGISYRTKTGTCGTPFALGGCGLSASKGAVSWISVWLHCLQQVWDCLRGADAAVEPDCLFFRCDLAARTFEPLSYTQCLRVFRTYLADWLGTHNSGKYSSDCLVSSDVSVDFLVSTYSLHSCKATVLSWLAQLDERPDVRLAQGHHSNPLLQSMTLYSRDSVFPALQAQSRLMSLLQLDFDSLHASDVSGRLRTVSGWSPVAPQHRGSQQPFAEPPLLDRGCLLDVVDPDSLSFPSFCAVPTQAVDASSLASAPMPTPPASTVQTAKTASDQFAAVTDAASVACKDVPVSQTSSLQEPDEVLFLCSRKVAHLAVEAAESSFRFQGKYWKPACGSLASEMCFGFECRLALCRHKACRVFVDREPLE